MLIPILFLLLGFVILLFGADFLVKGAASLARRYAVPEIVIGLTIVAFGTSTPELVVNIFSSFKGLSSMAYGNVIGSNNFNMLAILGISGLIYPLQVKANTVWKEIPFALGATLLLALLVNDTLFSATAQDKLSFIDGIILLIFFAGFIFYTVKISKEQVNFEEDTTIYSLFTSISFVVLGFVGLIGGGKLVVDYAVQLAQLFHVSEKVIGLTIVAAGTSLPELATSAVAAFKKHPDIAIGNVVGSNIFNILFILGVSAVIRPLPYPTSFNLDIALSAAATILLFVTMFIGKRHRLDRGESFFLLLVYIVYVVVLVMQP